MSNKQSGLFCSYSGLRCKLTSLFRPKEGNYNNILTHFKLDVKNIQNWLVIYKHTAKDHVQEMSLSQITGKFMIPHKNRQCLIKIKYKSIQPSEQ